jgi:hypothetical protein
VALGEAFEDFLTLPAYDVLEPEPTNAGDSSTTPTSEPPT